MRDPDLRSRLLGVADFGERAAQPPPVPGRDGRLQFGGLPTIFEDGTGSVPVLPFRRDAGLLAGAGFAQTRDGGRTWTRRSTDLAGRGHAAVHGMTFADATSGWLLSASLAGCGPGCDSKGAVLGTRLPVAPGRSCPRPVTRPGVRSSTAAPAWT